MTQSLRTTNDGRMAMLDFEVNILEQMTRVGDRSGFYVGYYAMTGNTEALLTAHISSFSERVRGVVFAAARSSTSLRKLNGRCQSI